MNNDKGSSIPGRWKVESRGAPFYFDCPSDDPDEAMESLRLSSKILLANDHLFLIRWDGEEYEYLDRWSGRKGWN